MEISISVSISNYVNGPSVLKEAQKKIMKEI